MLSQEGLEVDPMETLKPYYDDPEAGITIYHGDCRDILPHLPKVDLVLTDPPYSQDAHSGARTTGTMRYDGDFSSVRQSVDFASVTVDDIRGVLSRATPHRWCLTFGAFEHIAALPASPPSGLEFVRFGIWVKTRYTPQFTGDRPAQGFESIGIFHTKGKKRWNGGGTSAVWSHNNDHSGHHPTGKPYQLLADLVVLFSDAGETILDPFMGSGTTLVAAKQLGRKAIGIELEEKYCEIAVKRLAQKVLDFGQEVRS